MLPDMDVSPIVLDIETAGLPNAADFLEPVQAAKNLKDPEKIATDIATRTEERNQKLALDWNVGRIVAIGWWTERGGIHSRVCRDDVEEADAIRVLWAATRRRTLVGYNLKGFDLRFLIQRSRYLGLSYPMLDLGKYTRKGVVDLFSELTFNDGTYDQGAMRRTLHAFCKRFGVPVTDPTTGADIKTLVESGQWGAIEGHVRSDVALTVSLALKLGIVQPVPDVAEVL